MSGNLTAIDSIKSEIVNRSSGSGRCIIAVAGPPGAGKSTFAENLMAALGRGSAAVFQMDGFHYDNTVLEEMNLRDRKGAPETFDFAGFETMLRRLRSGNQAVAVPIFDRRLDLARAGAAVISETTKYIIVEGNYLLLAEHPWVTIFDVFDYRIRLDVPRKVLEGRLTSRWISLGITDEAARRRVAENDMLNVDRIITCSAKADLVVGDQPPGSEGMRRCPSDRSAAV